MILPYYYYLPSTSLHHPQTPFLSSNSNPINNINPPIKLQKLSATQINTTFSPIKLFTRRRRRRNLAIKGCSSSDHGAQEEGRKSFLSLEEAGLVEISGLSTHEKFLCRLTISSLNLLRVISEQEGCSIEELNAGRVCDWFVKDKLKREQNLNSAVLQWDESEFPI